MTDQPAGTPWLDRQPVNRHATATAIGILNTRWLRSRCSVFTMPESASSESQTFLVGVGIADITGEAGAVGMMGYAMPQQRTAGIHLRQWSRAFVIAEPGVDGKRVVFVNNDLGMIFTAVHQEVLRRLANRFGDRYTAANTILSATHTHSGPGGFSHYTLYNVTTAGFRPKTFEAIVAGIVTAIERADADLAPGQVSINTGELFGANINRSLLAFERNPETDKSCFPGAIDPAMTVLRFARNGSPVGALSWFPTHGTSMPNTNRLISSDNKGYAAYVWEHEWAGRKSLDKAAGQPGFVAGFAQGNAGDMSPNLGPGDAYGPTGNYFANTRVIGGRQVRKARALFDAASEDLSGTLDYRQRYVDFSHIELAGEYLSEYSGTRTWPAVIGQAFMSGTYDGAGVEFVRQGDLHLTPLTKALGAVARAPQDLIASAPPEVLAGQSPKPAALATGLCNPPWTPPILPLQIARIGQLAIIAAPGEFTITSGRRIRAAVASALGPGVRHIVFAGYSNAYSGYITTPEEYQAQRYEGGSTHFGPGTLPAYQQEFSKIAEAMVSDKATPSSVTPPDLSHNTWTIDPVARIFDVPGPRREFGDVIKEPKPSYQPGEMVEAKFSSASPNNDLRSGSTFIEVQHLIAGDWVTIASDDDWNTIFRWRRAFLGISLATVQWQIPPDVAVGSYRLVHSARARTRGGNLDFTGITQAFVVAA